MPGTTLADIRSVVRRLTKSPSTSQITDAQINAYINDFLVYEMPEELREKYLKSTVTFYTVPYQDVYETVDVPVTDPLYDFSNRYITVNPPLYIAGRESMFTQSRNEFFRYFPITESIIQVGTGNGVDVAFSGTLSDKPVLKNHVTVSAYYTDTTGVIDEKISLELHDDGEGVLTGAGGAGTIDYVSGAWTINFIQPPGTNVGIYFETVPFVPAIPSMGLFYEQKFVLRPVPDKVYSVQLEAYRLPSLLEDATSEPELKEWYRYLAYGAARQILQERLDMESLSYIEPEFKRQQILINRRTIVQQAGERTSTIYTDLYLPGSGYNYWNRS